MTGTSATTDPIATCLDGVRGDIGALEALVTQMATFAVPVPEFNAAQDRLAARTPRLLAAVEAALAEHYPNAEATPECEGCGHPWQCPTVAAISRALLGDTP